MTAEHETDQAEPTFVAGGGEPPAGTEPGQSRADDADDTVQIDPGSAGDTADIGEEGQPAVTPADPKAGESVD